MTDTRRSDPAADQAEDESVTAERLGTIKQRLADGYYQRPEIIDRIAAAVRRALGRAN